MKFFLLEILVVCSLLTGCSSNLIEEKEITNIEKVTSINEKWEDERHMIREFCIIETIDENMVLKNVKGDTYLLELLWKADFNEGDNVVLIYKNRTEVEYGVYTADVYAVYPDSMELEKTI